jgi:hypothetical protein
MRGNVASQALAWQRNDFWLWFPVSWDMCLVGSSLPLSGPTTRAFQAEQIAELRGLTISQAAVFVAAPNMLQDVQ